MVNCGAVVGVAAVASYEHAFDLVRLHGEAGWTARLVPLTLDGLIYASSMVMLDSAFRAARARLAGDSPLTVPGVPSSHLAPPPDQPQPRT